MDKNLVNTAASELEQDAEHVAMDPREIEVRLAIADYVIRRVASTPAGQEIFDALIRRFENRYPQHKLLAGFFICPEHLNMYSDDLED